MPSTIENQRMETTINIIYGPCLSAVCIIGVLGNAALFATFALESRSIRGQMNPMKPFILYLSTNDLLMLMVSWCLFSLPNFVPLTTNCLYLHMVPYLVSLNYLFHGTHIWGTVALTCDRFLAICLPLWTKTRKPRSLPRVMLVMASVASIGYAIPKLFEFEFVLVTGNYTGYDIRCQPSDNYTELMLPSKLSVENKSYQILYKIATKLILISSLPSLLLFCLTLCMLYNIYKTPPGVAITHASASIMAYKAKFRLPSSRKATIITYGDAEHGQSRKQGFSSYIEIGDFIPDDYPSQTINHHRRGIYKPLIGVIVIAVLCNTMPGVLNILELAQKGHDIMEYLYLLSNSLVILDASTTFYVNFGLSRPFWNLVKSCARRRQRTDNRRDIYRSVNLTSPVLRQFLRTHINPP